MNSVLRPELVITPGDPEGIGPEVTAKALRALRSELKHTRIKLFCSKAAFQNHTLPGLSIEWFEPIAPKLKRSASFSLPGFQSGWAIQAATHYLLRQKGVASLVTGPISKERLQAGGFAYRGHTDMLASLTNTPSVTMMLANEHFRVALLTDHCPLDSVSKQITPKLLNATFQNVYEFATRQLGKTHPKVALLGLNPHAGEGGLLGKEELKVMIPALRRAEKKWSNMTLEGPVSADSYFALLMRQKKAFKPDVIVACYHDQGLIPVKLSGFSQSVNLTLGLPFVRTSVDHGTAFSIANQNKADPGSMIYAIQTALKLQRKQKP